MERVLGGSFPPFFGMRVSVVACVMLLMLFAGRVGAERPVRSLLEMRQENLILQQWDNSCGAAALATILTYYNAFPVSERQVA